MTDTLLKLGRYFFAIPIVAFGVQYFLYGRFVGGLSPVPPWTPGGRAGAYLVGAALVTTGVGMLIDRGARVSALVLGGLFLACVVLLHTQKFAGIVSDGVIRTRALEPLAIAGAAFVLAGILTGSSPVGFGASWATHLGRFLVAFPMVIFGIQHFQFAPFIASLIPAWIPAHLFWAYFTGVAFILAGIAMEVPRLGRMAATWLGIMFLLWAVLLHAPRVVNALRNGDEWSSAFVAVAMSGGSFLVARSWSPAELWEP